MSPRAEFYSPEQQQLRHLRRLAERPGESPPASAASGQSRTDLDGEETPPSLPTGKTCCVCASLRPAGSQPPAPRLPRVRSALQVLATACKGSGLHVDSTRPSSSLPRATAARGSPRELRPRCGDPVRWPFSPPQVLRCESPALLGGLGRTGRGGDTRVSTRVPGAGGVPLFSRTVRTAATRRVPLFKGSAPPLFFVPEGAPAGLASERSHNRGEVGLGGDSGCPLSSESPQARRQSCESGGGGEVGDRYRGGKVPVLPHPSARPAQASQPRPVPRRAPPRPAPRPRQVEARRPAAARTVSPALPTAAGSTAAGRSPATQCGSRGLPGDAAHSLGADSAVSCRRPPPSGSARTS